MILKKHLAEAYCVARRHADRHGLTGKHRDYFFRMVGDLTEQTLDRRDRLNNIERLAGKFAAEQSEASL